MTTYLIAYLIFGVILASFAIVANLILQVNETNSYNVLKGIKVFWLMLLFYPVLITLGLVWLTFYILDALGIDTQILSILKEHQIPYIVVSAQTAISDIDHQLY
jgi:hypothetical protein